MEYNIQLVENLIQEIFKYNQGIPNSELAVLIMDEIESPHYINGAYKLIPLSNHSYTDYHYCIAKDNVIKYYDIFILEKEDIDEHELYQITFCNSYTKIIKFDQSNYSGAINVANFKNPGMVYSFYDGSILIVESNERIYHTYKDIYV